MHVEVSPVDCPCCVKRQSESASQGRHTKSKRGQQTFVPASMVDGPQRQSGVGQSLVHVVVQTFVPSRASTHRPLAQSPSEPHGLPKSVPLSTVAASLAPSVVAASLPPSVGA